MIFAPSAKALAYGEINFIATSVPVPSKSTPIRQIFDEIAIEMQLLFLEDTSEQPANANSYQAPAYEGI